MEKRRILFKSLLSIFIFSLCICFAGTSDASAASSNSAKYSMKKKDRSKTYKNRTAQVYYNRVVLKDSSSAINKINSSIKADMNDFLQGEKVAFTYEAAKTCETKGLAFYCYANSKVTYNNNKVISIRVQVDWYNGGVHYIDCYGLTYSLKTGKQLKLSDVCSYSNSKIKTKLLSKVDSNVYGSDIFIKSINTTKVKDMKFYLKPKNKVMVCFSGDENGSNNARELKIKSIYA